MLNNYSDFLKQIKSFDKKPSLLIHACCAPCSSHVLLLLKDYFDITIFYSNDNIYPEAEYNLRLNEVIDFAKNIDNINVIYDDYISQDFYNAIKGLEHLGEKSQRCYNCYSLRLDKTAKKALELKYDYFTTTLSISPYKNSEWINEIGYKLQDQYQVNYLYSNFKKDNGYKNSIELSKKYNLYRQDYCGCVFSQQERADSLDRAEKEN